MDKWYSRNVKPKEAAKLSRVYGLVASAGIELSDNGRWLELNLSLDLENGQGQLESLVGADIVRFFRETGRSRVRDLKGIVVEAYYAEDAAFRCISVNKNLVLGSKDK